MFINRIKSNCLKLKSKTVYICGESNLTYGELWEKATNLAAFLESNGSSPVIVYGHKSPYMIISFLACIISGRAYVPCDISVPPLRIESIISATKSELMIATEAYESENLAVINIGKLWQICDSKNECLISEDGSRTAYVIFTSGSTGTPKGVPISINNLDHFINWVTSIPAVSILENGIVFNQVAFSFDLSVADLYISLVRGHTLFASARHEQQDLALLFQRLKLSGSMLIVCTPTFIQMCLSDAAFNRELLPDLQVVFLCGEVFPVKTAEKLFDRFPGIKLINAYGPTEATCAVAAVEITEEMFPCPALPVGEINHAAVRISIMDGEKELPDGECGEIMLHGDSVSSGYLGESCRPFAGDKNYLTGDIGKIQNGYLYYSGRIDEQIKYKGYRIEPMEIECCINEIEGIVNAIVIPVEGRHQKIVMLVAFAEKTEDITADSIKMELSKKLPYYMIPKTIIFIDQIPMNSNGKCDRKALMEIFYHGRNG
jgi:Non-ribosomal peptide synthetase modules and related proteins